jgi:proteasome lid subunit RPN8/RPN11
MARAALPHEACALVSGRIDPPANGGDDEAIVALAVHSVANSLRSPTAFALDGEEMMAAGDLIDAAGQTLIGVMHSHPTSAAAPSRRDLADANNYDPNANLVQIIVSMQGFVPSVRAFRYHRDGGAPGEFELILST